MRSFQQQPGAGTSVVPPLLSLLTFAEKLQCALLQMKTKQFHFLPSTRPDGPFLTLLPLAHARIFFFLSLKILQRSLTSADLPSRSFLAKRCQKLSPWIVSNSISPLGTAVSSPAKSSPSIELWGPWGGGRHPACPSTPTSASETEGETRNACSAWETSSSECGEFLPLPTPLPKLLRTRVHGRT